MSHNSNKPDRRTPVPVPGSENRGFMKGFLFWMILFAGVILLVNVITQYTTSKPKDIDLSEFYSLLQTNRIEQVKMRDTELGGTLRRTSPSEAPVTFSCRILEPQVGPVSSAILDWNQKANEKKVSGEPVQFESQPRSQTMDLLLIYGLPSLLLFVVAWIFLGRLMRASGGGGVLAFGKSRARLVNKERVNVSFNDVAGIEEATEEVKEIVDFLKSPRKFHRLGGRIPRGVLLIGPPGTGKTLLAKAIAGEAEVPFFSISGSDFVEMFVGVGASRVRDLFSQAKSNAPCIIFLDEIDAVGRRRGAGLGGGHDEREQTLNAILVEMDGFERDDSVIVIAATNRPDVLDPALIRPGRFDRQVVLDLPDIRGRKAILDVHAKKYKLSSDVNLEQMARGTPYFSGADLEAVLNEAALSATREDKESIEMIDLEEARDKVHWGRQKRSRVMDEDDRRITAIHESGHALIAMLLPDLEPVHKVTIIPQGPALGATMYLPEKDRYHVLRKKLRASICGLLGGRAAEEIECSDVSSGAQNDLERATSIARAMVCQWGMSDRLGPITYQEEEETVFLGREITRRRDHSEAVSVMIDEEIKNLVMSEYQHARDLIEKNREKLLRLYEALLKYETLRGSDLDKLMAGETLPEPKTPDAGRPGIANS